jgi:hypothetical protein
MAATDVVRDHLRRVLAAGKNADDRRRAMIESAEAAGKRIVSGSSLGRDTWEIHDWRTRQTLARGSGGIAELDEVLRCLDPAGNWLHIDHFGYDDELLSHVVTAGLPGDLGSILQDWIQNTDTSDEEIAAFIDWPVEKVAECRADSRSWLGSTAAATETEFGVGMPSGPPSIGSSTPWKPPTVG